MASGISRVGDRPKMISTARYAGVDADVAVFYGYDRTMRGIFRDYREAGLPVVYIDLGYWGRREGGQVIGFHKVSVNDRHPTAYFRNRRHDGSRARRFGIEIRPWRQGRNILLAGMSAKSAESYGMTPAEWERKAIAALRKATDRPILYRPKPSWKEARPLAGSLFAPRRGPIDDQIENCHAVVTHHSNVGVDALIAGVPVFTIDGVASVMGIGDIGKIESPIYPEGRDQWVDDIAWCQWHNDEMRSGACWRHLKDEGLV